VLFRSPQNPKTPVLTAFSKLRKSVMLRQWLKVSK